MKAQLSNLKFERIIKKTKISDMSFLISLAVLLLISRIILNNNVF